MLYTDSNRLNWEKPGIVGTSSIDRIYCRLHENMKWWRRAFSTVLPKECQSYGITSLCGWHAEVASRKSILFSCLPYVRETLKRRNPTKSSHRSLCFLAKNAVRLSALFKVCKSWRHLSGVQAETLNLLTMPKSFLIRTSSSRRHRTVPGPAKVGRIVPDLTELRPLDYPVTSWVTFIDNSPLDFTIRSSEKKETNTSGLPTSVDGLYIMQ